jgi:metal-responsive CopG/Arc/MetJ family transcriptional regulator
MSTNNPETSTDESIRLTVNFSRSLLGKIDEVRKAWGFRSRGATVERILQELFADDTGEEPGVEETSDQPPLP